MFRKASTKLLVLKCRFYLTVKRGMYFIHARQRLFKGPLKFYPKLPFVSLFKIKRRVFFANQLRDLIPRIPPLLVIYKYLNVRSWEFRQEIIIYGFCEPLSSTLTSQTTRSTSEREHLFDAIEILIFLKSRMSVCLSVSHKTVKKSLFISQKVMDFARGHCLH